MLALITNSGSLHYLSILAITFQSKAIQSMEPMGWGDFMGPHDVHFEKLTRH